MREKLSKYLTQIFIAYCHVMTCQQARCRVRLSGRKWPARWSKPTSAQPLPTRLAKQLRYAGPLILFLLCDMLPYTDMPGRCSIPLFETCIMIKKIDKISNERSVWNVISPTATLLEHYLLAQGFMGVQQATSLIAYDCKTVILRVQIWSKH